MIIKDLIKQLQTEDPDRQVLFQYVVADDTHLDEERFGDLVHYLERSSFADEISIFFNYWLQVADDEVE
jgi:hypothetical protein